MAKITYADKVDRRISNVPENQKATAADMNEIKSSVNTLYDERPEYVKVVLDKADINTLFSNKVLAVPGVDGKYIKVVDCAAIYEYDTNPFTIVGFGNIIRLFYHLIYTVGALGDITGITQNTFISGGPAVSTNAGMPTGEGLYIGALNEDYGGGGTNSKLIVHIWYRYIDAEL